MGDFRAVRLRAFQQPPFFTIVCGPRKSGKTFWTMRALRDVRAYAGTFDHLVIISPTVYLDWTWSLLDFNDPNVTVFDDFRIKYVEELHKACIKRRKRGEHTLLVIDDSVCASEFRDYVGSKKEHPLAQIAVHGRHRLLSCIVISQKLKRLSPTLRTNADQAIFFRPLNGSEMDQICSDFGPFCREKKAFRQFCGNIWLRGAHTFVNCKLTGDYGVYDGYDTRRNFARALQWKPKAARGGRGGRRRRQEEEHKHEEAGTAASKAHETQRPTGRGAAGPAPATLPAQQTSGRIDSRQVTSR